MELGLLHKSRDYVHKRPPGLLGFTAFHAQPGKEWGITIVRSTGGSVARLVQSAPPTPSCIIEQCDIMTRQSLRHPRPKALLCIAPEGSKHIIRSQVFGIQCKGVLVGRPDFSLIRQLHGPQLREPLSCDASSKEFAPVPVVVLPSVIPAVPIVADFHLIEPLAERLRRMKRTLTSRWSKFRACRASCRLQSSHLAFSGCKVCHPSRTARQSRFSILAVHERVRR